LERIGKVQQDLKSARADVRWVSPYNIHLTLKFFGNIEESQIDAIVQTITGPARTMAPISITVQGTGAFPGLKNPRVIWIGLYDKSKVLASFQRQLEGELQKIGFPSEDRPFHPHLTLGRMRTSRGKDDLIRGMERYREEGFGSFQADRVVLFKSDLRPEGAVYTRLREVKLGDL